MSPSSASREGFDFGGSLTPLPPHTPNTLCQGIRQNFRGLLTQRFGLERGNFFATHADSLSLGRQKALTTDFASLVWR